MESTILERDIFGGSESELSSEEETRNRVRRTSPRAPQEGVSSGSEDNYDDSQRRDKKLRFKTRSKEDGGAGGKAPRKKRKRRAPSQEVEEPQIELSPEEQRRLALNQKIDSIIKPSKHRPKKRKKGDEEMLDRYADDEVNRLREEMNQAADADCSANMEKRPATAKLRMLPEVMEVLQKQSLIQSIFDNNLLAGVKKWLEPLPDKSLPALNIQNAFFEVLQKMDIDTNTLKESGLGKVILFYTRCKRVTLPIKRAADNLVEVWSRPIIKRSASYRDKIIPTATVDVTSTKPEKLSVILARAREAEAGRIRKNAVSIPQSDLGSYTVAPKAAVLTGPSAHNNAAEVEKRRAHQERLRKMQRKLALNSQKNSRM
ncbi:Transcription factor iws1 [Tulasnella sp. 419]|nr:Transcription factor iws1 [Tulasnella sp. 419]